MMKKGAQDVSWCAKNETTLGVVGEIHILIEEIMKQNP